MIERELPQTVEHPRVDDNPAVPPAGMGELNARMGIEVVEMTAERIVVSQASRPEQKEFCCVSR